MRLLVHGAGQCLEAESTADRESHCRRILLRMQEKMEDGMDETAMETRQAAGALLHDSRERPWQPLATYEKAGLKVIAF